MKEPTNPETQGRPFKNESYRFEKMDAVRFNTGFDMSAGMS